MARQSKRAWAAMALLVVAGRVASAGEAPAEAAPAEDPARAQLRAQFEALHWVHGPADVEVAGNSILKLPAGYMTLDAANTKKFVELTHNLGDGQEVLVAPEDLHWASYFEFDDSGYIKDNDKIDAPELLKSLQESTEQGNEQRKDRGWPALHIQGWAVPPAYNSDTRRLEWATTLESEGETNVNFFTKILGRRGYTSVVLVSEPGPLPQDRKELAALIEGYSFKPGETYAEWRSGDKVAEYGLAALVLGGAAAVATKKGFWAVLGTFFAAAWKFIVAGAVAASAWLRRLFSGRKQEG